MTRALLAAAALCAAWLCTTPQPVRAYSSFADYMRPIEEGGGGGLLFTGTPADAYGCDVCHRGGQVAKLEVLGLPADGYVPGQSYAITFQWPATTHVALMAEFTDTAGLPAGTTALAPYATWEEGELCENGFPAADVCRPDATTSGCCRDVAPDRDACSFPGERSVFWVLDCRSKFARLTWTAPPAGAGDVWFSSDMVNSDLKNDALGDAATLVRRRLRPSGAPQAVTSAVGGCQAAAGARTRSPWAASGCFALLVALLRLRGRPQQPRRYSQRLP